MRMALRWWLMERGVGGRHDGVEWGVGGFVEHGRFALEADQMFADVGEAMARKRVTCRGEIREEACSRGPVGFGRTVRCVSLLGILLYQFQSHSIVGLFGDGVARLAYF